jgi:hypothetical protein
MVKVSRLVDDRFDDPLFKEIGDAFKSLAEPKAQQKPAAAKPAPVLPKESTPTKPTPSKPDGGSLSNSGKSPMTTVDRSEVARFVAAFGPQGATWWAEGKSFTEAREEYLKSTHGERERIWAAGNTRNMARFALGCKPPGQR